MITDIQKTRNLPPVSPDFEGIRYENGKPVFYFSQQTRKLLKAAEKDRPAREAARLREQENLLKMEEEYKKQEEKIKVKKRQPERRESSKPTMTNVVIQNNTQVKASAKQSDIGKKHYKIFDLPVTAVLRWMGSEGWSTDHARRALDKLGLDVSNSTISCQVKGWEYRGDVPDLTDKQQEELWSLLKDNKPKTVKKGKAKKSKR